jgi:hypothetical protein
MPIDPSIALNANAPKPINPLQQALSVAQFRALNASGLAQQQQLDANRATSAAYQQATDPTTGQVDNNKLVGILSQDPAAAYNLPQVIQGINTQKQQQQTLQTGQLDQSIKAQSSLRQGLGSLLTKPDLSAQDVQGFATTQLQAGAITPQVYQAEMQSMPQDPQGLRAWVQQHYMSALSGETQLHAMLPQYAQVNTGPATVAVNQNPMAAGGGVGTVGYTVQNGLSPSEATAQVPVINPDGSQGTRSKASVLQQQGLGGLLPQAAQGAGAGGGNGRYPGGGNGGVVQTSPAAGVVDATQKANAAGGDQWVADQSANAASNTRINMLGNALTSLQGATTGNGADKLQAVKSLLVTLGAAPQATVDSVQNFDEANKYLTQYAQQKAAGFGHGTDAQLAASISGNGNTHISNLAAQDVVRVNLALERMEQARTAAFQQQLDAGAVKPSDYSSWKSKFGSSMDPRVFIADQMPLAKTQAMVKSMTPAQQATFKAQYNWAAQNGYINGPQ